MKLKGLVTLVLLCFFSKIIAEQPSDSQSTLKLTPEIIDTDSILNVLTGTQVNITDSIVRLNSAADSTKVVANPEPANEIKIIKIDSTQRKQSIHSETERHYQIPKNIALIPIDSLILMGNPFFIDLVFNGIKLDFNWKKPDLRTLYYGKPAAKITDNLSGLPAVKRADEFINELRNDARNEITKNAANLYCTTFDKLPDPSKNKNRYIEGIKIDKVQFVEDKSINPNDKKINVQKAQIGPWFHKASTLAQFSQNYISPNWYQGGNSNIAVLGILSGQLIYDNKKSVQWENNAEWRMGFNSVEGDSIHPLSTNDDVFKINSKLGIKAGGNWFYSGSVDFSTQFFNSYKGMNSTALKASFLTPVRLNVGVGFDYKYKKIFSLLLSPVSYKYIFVNDTVRMNQNMFGIKKGMNYLSEVGSSFKAVVSYPLTREIQLDSKLSFYTNYEKVEIDWEIVCNMAINRFLSTRISVNPRYDNTVIGEKAGIQFKQLLSVGFSHKFN